MNIIKKLKDSLGKELGALTGLILLGAIMTFATPYFLTLTNLMNILRQSSLIAIAAAGMTFVIITGGIDLSVGSVLSLSSCLTAGMMVSLGWNVWLAVFLGLIAGGILGIVNGVLITRVPLPPFISTLGMMGVARGLSFVYTDGAPIYGLPESFKYLGAGMIGPIPFPAILMVIIYLISYFLLNKTKVGRYAYALGGNEEAAILSGINTKKYKTIVYALTGLFASISGMILSARLDAATSVAGDGFELDVIAAVVIGGTSLSGGRGKIIGSLIGALIMGVVRNGLNLLLVSSHWQRVILGLIILLAVTVDVVRKQSSEDQDGTLSSFFAGLKS
ncbi:ABC transporter permease [Halanaerobium kushneri]|jgi:ribose transport system permease protein|uniref:Ribose transport system permease protein n=1 Tax=Halanaerobium kushneri TaxID=56779 RepID=A0A1N6U0W3_9FIRM|nr:ribose ABC transporter permease [Halanaerobium kushneri]SIQ59260.1 ribose transport system permease protein [Halanaerobium kushneri]